jgi:hypothetical protein
VVKKKGVPLKVRLTGVVVGVLGERTIKPGTPDEVEGEGVSLLPRGPFNWLWPWVALRLPVRITNFKQQVPKDFQLF